MSILTNLTDRSVDEMIDGLEKASSRVSGSVAVIHAMIKSTAGTESAIGTAYCVDKRGYFVTALHVVQGHLSSFIVTQQLFETRLVAVDEANDLALVQVIEPNGKFVPVTFAKSVNDSEIVAGLGYPDRGMAVELCSYLARYAGAVVDGVGPNGLILEDDSLQTALSFAGGEPHTNGYSGGPIINEAGEVVASTIKADDELGFIIGPSAATIVDFINQHI